ncbi:hypothetical protein [Nocardioides solisilvae]|uniref:hypothetical protein n=1 Tax=Nocardioides solisilvae TaxID=1542435 RepID=UPI000D743F46|nr:hypothetical protein [Nocardioides solisilvae]
MALQQRDPQPRGAAAPTGLAAGERWFLDHGLPYFVDGVRARVERGLRRGRLVAVAVTAALLAAVTFGVALPLSDRYVAGAAALTAVGVVVAGYALATLRIWLWLRWATGKTFSSLGLMVPLVARALPMLMLFITFLFINAEVWQVAARLSGGVMWTAVLGFAAAAVGFLLFRLPEEVDALTAQLDRETVAGACAGTPFVRFAGAVGRIEDLPPPTRLERANLVLVLLASQAVQVLLLSVAVFAFFLGFGLVAIPEEVVTSWVGVAPTSAVGELSWELVRVSVFLAAFSGLYFAVYAVTDETYRRQFFTGVTDDMEKALATRCAYRAALRP